MSSLAALPLATMPAELPAPVWPGVPRNPSWNAFRSRKDLRSSPALMKHGSSNFPFEAAWTAVAEQSCSAKLYHQWAAGQLSPAPTAIGATPDTVLSLVMSALRPSNGAGGAGLGARVRPPF